MVSAALAFEFVEGLRDCRLLVDLEPCNELRCIDQLGLAKRRLELIDISGGDSSGLEADARALSKAIAEL